MSNIPDRLAGKYKIQCTACGAEGMTEFHLGCGFQVGQLVPPDSSNPAYARCHRCKRHKMKVISAPPSPPPNKPKGFRHVPEK